MILFFLSISFQAECFRYDACSSKLGQLENFLSLLICQAKLKKVEMGEPKEEKDYDDNMCCICYAAEADARFVPCSHRSCYGCITRHLLNCQRCFFCNANVLEVDNFGEYTA